MSHVPPEPSHSRELHALDAVRPAVAIDLKRVGDAADGGEGQLVILQVQVQIPLRQRLVVNRLPVQATQNEPESQVDYAAGARRPVIAVLFPLNIGCWDFVEGSCASQRFNDLTV